MISIKNKNILGLSLLEALVSTAIIGIGFVSILQMTNYSVQSMQTSGERTKANFLTSVIAEDVISSRDSSTSTHSKFSHFLISEQNNEISDDGNSAIFSTGVCSSASGSASANTDKIYGTTETDAHSMKLTKWKSLLNNKSYLRCHGENEKRTFKVYKLCRYDNAGEDTTKGGSGVTCDFTNTLIQDEELFIGRVQINLNQGNKRKYLYFQSDYKLLGKNVVRSGDGDDDGDDDGGGDGGDAG